MKHRIKHFLINLAFYGKAFAKLTATVTTTPWKISGLITALRSPRQSPSPARAGTAPSTPTTNGSARRGAKP